VSTEGSRVREARRVGAIARSVRSLQDGYGLVLILTLATITSLAVVGLSPVGSVLTVILGATTLGFVLRTSRAPARVQRAMRIVLLAAIAIPVVAALAGGGDAARLSGAVLGLALAVVVPPVIALHIARSPVITFRLVLGALVIYLMFGLAYAYLYPTLADIGGAPIFVQTPDPSVAAYVYFSYTTLTTVGYGDLTMSGDLMRMIAISEALVGQLYLVSAVAVLAGNLGRSIERPARPEGQ
jgi:Ion channel